MGSDSAGAKTFEYASLQVCSWNSRFFSARVALASGQWPWKKSWKAFRTSVRASMSDSERLLGDPPQAVWIHVYDLVQANVYLHALGAGLYHTSVEAFGKEWAFGGHDVVGQSGIYAVPASSMPREPGARVGTEEQYYVYRQSLAAGTTDLTEADVERIIQNMGRNCYQGTRYHILQRNCNHFADDLVKKLGGTGTPHWINRLANLAVWLHCLVPPGYLPDLIEERGRAAASQISGRGDPY